MCVILNSYIIVALILEYISILYIIYNIIVYSKINASKY